MRDRRDDSDDDERPRRRAKVVRPVDDDGDEPVAAKGKTIAGMPRWLAVVLAGVVALPILACGGVIVLAAVLPKSPAGTVAAGELPPVAFGTPADFGDVQVAIQSAKVSTYGGRDWRGDELTSVSPAFVVTLAITTKDKAKVHGADAATGAATLTDNFGTRLATTKLENKSGFGTCKIFDQLEAGSRYEVRSDKTLTDCLVFVRPVEGATSVTLKIKAAGYGGKGYVTFVIPSSAWAAAK